MPSPWPTDCSTPRESPPGRADAIRAELAVAIVRAANPIAILRMMRVLCSEQPSLSESNSIVLDGLQPCGTVARREPRGERAGLFCRLAAVAQCSNTRPDGFATADGAIRAASAKAPVTANALTEDDIDLQHLPPGLDVPLGVRLTRPAPAFSTSCARGLFWLPRSRRCCSPSGEAFT
jgi:hypothetical protein